MLRCGFQNTNPERGRKPDMFLGLLFSYHESFQNTNPERGRKRSPFLFVQEHFQLISKHEPRKGTETINSSISYKNTFSAFQNTNPERGRKLLETLRSRGVHVEQFQNTNPERGRKLGSRVMIAKQPQRISKHEPRKGTETYGIASWKEP